MKTIWDKFRVDDSTYLLMLLALLSGYIKNVFIIFIIVLIHEFGHVFFFYLFKIEIDSVVIYPFGGVSKVNKRIHERIYKDIIISLGGIFFQVLLIVIFYYLYECDFIVRSTYEMFYNYNKNVILFNLIPMIPLDGSKLLLSVLTKFCSYKKSYLVMLIVGALSLGFFISYNFIFRLNDFVINVFLLVKLFETIRDFKYVLNKFYLERILYDNYYDGIVSDGNLEGMRLDKYYFFKENNVYINERSYIKKNKF